MIRLLVPLAMLAAGTAAEARFAPRIGTAYRLLRVQDRDDGSGVRRFATERTLVFARRPGGYVAHLSLPPGGARDSAGSSAYAALSQAIGAEPVEVELDAGGRIVRVRALAAIWSKLRAAIGERTRDDGIRLALWRAHDAATDTQRTQVVAGTLAAVLAPDEAERRAGGRPVTLPAEGVGPRRAALTGRETIVVGRHRVTATIVAEGDAPDGRITLTRRRVVDRATGLLVEQHDRQRSVADGAGVDSRTTITLTPQVS